MAGEENVVRFGVLGSLEVVDDDGAAVDLGGAQPRLVLAMLVLAAGRVVTADALIDAVWGEDRPASAAGTLQSYISRLRRGLEPGRRSREEAKVLLYEPPGYRLAAGVDEVDFRRFERLADEGRALLAEGHAEDARASLVAADALWRGPALVEFADHEFASGVAHRLEERRVVATEDRIAADLALGRHAAVIGELGQLVQAHPLREGLRASLALALYRAGRQADALRSLDDARRTLRDELGVEPGRSLRDLEAAILSHDLALDAVPVTMAGTPLPDAGSDAGSTTTTSPPAVASSEEPDGAPARDRLVGRDSELDELHRALDEVLSGCTRIVIAEGEPGIGKTRLIEELCAEAARRGAPAHWGRAFEGGAAPAFWPWLPVLRALAADDGGAGPELATILAPDDLAGGGHAVGDAGRFALVDSVVELLRRRSAAGPLVLVLDDLQWADAASLELLTGVATRLPDAPLLLAVTVRELELGRNDAVVDTLAALTRRSGTRRLHLRGITAEATQALVAQTTGVAVDAEVAATIHDRAEGNPFFAGELARLLASGDRVAMADVPSGVRDVVRRRLGQLPPTTVELLQVAAAIGRDLDPALVAKASGRDLDACLDDLDTALVHRLLTAHPDDPGLQRFAHALVREVLIDDLAPLRRARLHLRIADALDGSDDLAEIVAEHLWEAVPIGVGARAADALERAAEVAVRRLAYASAEDLLERAARLRRTTGSGPDGLDAELDVVARLVAVIGAGRGYASLQGSAVVARGRELAEQTGRTTELLNMLWAEWAALDVTCQYRRADPIAEELLALAERLDTPLARVVGYTAMGISRWHRGDITGSAAHLDVALATADELGPEDIADILQNLNQIALAAPFAAYMHDVMGDIDDPEAHYDAVVRRVPDDRYWELVVMNFAASGGLSTGDLDRSERASRRGLAADPDGMSAFWSVAQRLYLGAALCRKGDLETGLPLLDESWARYTAIGQRTNGVTLLAARGQGLAQAGRLDEATTTLAEARAELEQYGERYAEPALLCAEGTLAHARGDDPAAVAAIFRRAHDLALEQGSLSIARRAVYEAETIAGVSW